MKKTKLFLISFLAFILYQMSLPCQAHAYIDPGSGSYVVEVIIATILGGIFVLKLYWRKIKGIFTSKKNGRKKR